MLNKYEKLVEKLFNVPQLGIEISEKYQEEYEENLETILVLKDTDFMRVISLHVKSYILETYSDKAFENFQFASLLKKTEIEFYQNVYLKDKTFFTQALNQFQNSSNSYDTFCFRKHCKYQDDVPLHFCDQNNHFKLIYENNSIYGVICTNCKYVYKPNYIKLYCNFSYVSYYSSIIDSEVDNNIQPATWEKYHCNLIMNEQMKCIKCKYPLSLDIKNNILICLQCHFQTDPSCILWKCFKCGQEFHSGAKIYNPYEYKPLALAIKKSMFDKINAAPPILKCGHSSQGIKHKADCNGDLYVAQLNERKMVLCSKCNALIKYEKFIWICPVCNERCRDDGSLASLQSKSITPNVDAMKIINKRNQTFRNSSYKNPINNTVNFSLKNSYNILHSQRDSDGSSKIKTFLNKKDKKGTLYQQAFSPLISTKINDFFTRKSYSTMTNKNDFDSSINYSNLTKTINTSNHNTISFSSLIYKQANPRKKKEDSAQIPFLNLSDYELISQIGQGRLSKVFCAKEQETYSFFAMKKEIIPSTQEQNNKIAKLGIQYTASLSNNFITKIHSINVTGEELSILQELAINNWNSEIITMKKTKKPYTELELVSIFYQLSTAMESLQQLSYAHCNLTPLNVLIFKDKIYKICDFDNISKSITQMTKESLEENKFISPNLNQYIHDLIANPDNKESMQIDLIKSDVYSLALCGLFTMTPSNDPVGMIMDFVQINKEIIDKDVDNNYIEKMILKYMDYVNKLTNTEMFYSSKLVQLLSGMMCLNEKKRFNFSDLKNFIKNEYSI